MTSMRQCQVSMVAGQRFAMQIAGQRPDRSRKVDYTIHFLWDPFGLLIRPIDMDKVVHL